MKDWVGGTDLFKYIRYLSGYTSLDQGGRNRFKSPVLVIIKRSVLSVGRTVHLVSTRQGMSGMKQFNVLILVSFKNKKKIQ